MSILYIRGDDGLMHEVLTIRGKSAYQSYLDSGGALSEAQWVASLRGNNAPPYAPTPADMTDQTKVYLGSDGNLWAYGETEITTEPQDVFQNSGLQANMRQGTTSVSAYNGYVLSGLIPVDLTKEAPYVVRIKGLTTAQKAAQQNRLGYYNASGACVVNSAYWYEERTNNAGNWCTTVYDGDDVLLFIDQYSNTGFTAEQKAQITHIRICIGIKPGTGTNAGTSISLADVPASIQVLLEADRQTTIGSGFLSTGIKYANYALTDSDADLITDKILDRMDVSYVSSDKVLTVGQYTFRYDGEAVADIGVTE